MNADPTLSPQPPQASRIGYAEAIRRFIYNNASASGSNRHAQSGSPFDDLGRVEQRRQPRRSAEPIRPDQAVFTSKEAANYLRHSEQTLRTWRTQGKGPDFTKQGRTVTYTLEAIKAWQAANQFINTAGGKPTPPPKRATRAA